MGKRLQTAPNRFLRILPIDPPECAYDLPISQGRPEISSGIKPPAAGLNPDCTRGDVQGAEQDVLGGSSRQDVAKSKA